MQLAELLNLTSDSLPDVAISGVKLDSRQVANGDLFVAVPGYLTDGRHYIDAAIDAGATAILAEADSFALEYRHQVPVISLPAIKQQLSAIAGRFFAEPSSRAKVIGVTGTNGKTSVTHIIAQLASRCGDEAAVIGTTGSGLIGRLLPEKHTTPDAVTVQQRLATLVAEGAKVIAMEVSSHALVQHRVEALQFAAVAATNISRDHLDYHGTLNNYIAAKKRLFDDFHAPHKVVNTDDVELQGWLASDGNGMGVALADLHSGFSPALLAEHVDYAADGTQFTVREVDKSGNTLATESIASPLLGQFNVYNLLTALAALRGVGYSLSELAQQTTNLRPVPGRMEAFQNDRSALIVVDYAHTPDALQQVLQALRKHCAGQLWCVFGLSLIHI